MHGHGFYGVIGLSLLVGLVGGGTVSGEDPAALVAEAGRLAEQGKSAEAVAQATRALKADPKLSAAYYLRGRENFRLGRISASAADFDKYVELEPSLAPRQWERGITLYYAGRFADGAQQFEDYQTFDNRDVENSVWRYLCLARSVGVAKARETMLPIANDRRIPMMDIYEMYRGQRTPEQVLAAARAGQPSAEVLAGRLFYAHLYLGLFYEVEGKAAEARKYLELAADEKLATQRGINHYMWDVARIHFQRLDADAESLPPPDDPQIAPASPDAEQALAGFKLPAGWQGKLFAAEPLLANPVSFGLDAQGRVYVCETFRQGKGVEDNRGREYWLDDDLAAQTVADRIAYVRKHLKEKAAEFTRQDDRLRLLVDRDSDGVADESTVFAQHFHRLQDGTGAGVLAWRGDVYYACIPDLWRLRDENGDGVADQRQVLHTGYGVRYAFRGHDLHGLILGPDGKLYFSLGDRGYNVVSAGRRWKNPECGAVFRCNLDGTGLEVFAYGLRNPQELAFDDLGNLFTGDNNSDSGDRARWVYVVEGGDSGWRMSYQYLPDRGPFNREKIWHPAHPEQPAYLAPPIANLASGPSGLAYDPGVGLSDHFRRRFFLCDFRGGPGGSGIRTFRVKPRGASFELIDEELSIANILATDVDFGPDGALYVSDWVDGWNGLGKGRIYRFYDPAQRQRREVRQVQELLAANLATRTADDLRELLGHADRRVRQAAQFALVDQQAIETFAATAKTAAGPAATLPRIHALWGLGQLAAREALPESVVQTALTLLDDSDDEVRAHAAKLVGELPTRPQSVDGLINKLTDTSPRVQYFAALGLGNLGEARAVVPLIGMLARNDDQDPMLRHAAVLGLARLGGYRGWEPKAEPGPIDVSIGPRVEPGRGAARRELVKHLQHPAPAVRIGLAVALRRLGMPDLARLLDDSDPRVVLEAARGIHDEPIFAAWPALAQLASQDLASDPLARRVLNANFRLGGPEQAQAIARVAARESTSESMRIEAIEMLATWAKPSPRDRVLNMWRPIGERDSGPAVAAFRQVLPTLVARSDKSGTEAARRAAELGIQEVGPALHAILNDRQHDAAARADALRALATLKDMRLVELARQATSDEQADVRVVGRDLLSRLNPSEGLPLLKQAVEARSMRDRQGAFATLAAMRGPAVDELLAAALDRLLAGEVPLDSRLDLLTAANVHDAETVQARLQQFEARRPKDDPLAPFAEAVAGGDPRRGAQIFFERAQVSCVRCHKIQGRGGDVGPDLTKIANDKQPAYLLESIVLPNKTIAKNFESVLVVDDSGQIHSGVLKSESDTQLQLMSAEGQLVTIDKSTIEERRAAKSPMPEDLIKYLSPLELRDLVAYLSTLKGGAGG